MASTTTSLKYDTAKRRSGGEYLCDIMPAELMLEIGSNLDLSTKLKLRTALPKRRQDIVNDLLADPLKTLYLSPTKGSLHKFERITEITFFQQNITEVIFTPDAVVENRPGDDETFPYLPNVSHLDHKTAEEVLDTHRRLADEYKHWSVNAAFWALGDDSINYEVSASLVAGLQKLPRLAAASVQLKIHQDGLNASNLSYTEDLLKRRMAASSHAINSDFGWKAVEDLQGEVHDHEGIDTFLHAISVAEANIVSLSLGRIAGDQLDFDMQRFTDLSGIELERLLPSLTELNISCEDSWDLGIDEDAWWWRHIAEAATGMQTLRIGAGDQVQAHRFDNDRMGCKVVDHFLRHGNYPNLRTFEASGGDLSASVMNADLVASFFKRHAGMLQQIKLHGIMISNGRETTSNALLQTYRTLLEQMQTSMSSLTSVEMSIYRFRAEDSRSCSCHETGADNCAKGCLVYYLPACRMHLVALDNIAKRFDLVERNGRWDFGEYVMRRRQEMPQ